MKCFLIAILILVLIAVIIISNTLYINKVSNYLASLTDDAIASGIGGVTGNLDTVEDRWNEAREFLSMSVSYIEIDKIDTRIILAKSAAAENNESDYLRHMELLKTQFENLTRLERLSTFNILYVILKKGTVGKPFLLLYKRYFLFPLQTSARIHSSHLGERAMQTSLPNCTMR